MKDNKVSHGEEAASVLPCPASPRHRILVVDDDIFIRRLNTDALSQLGYEVDAAEDGSVAWDNLQRKSYDLVVTDNEMPNLSGVELFFRLRAAHLALPVIMATGTLPNKESTQYPLPQPVATLHKPYTLVELVGAVQAVLRATGDTSEQKEPPQNQPSAEVWPL